MKSSFNFLPRIAFVLALVSACSSLPGDSEPYINPRFSGEKQEMVRQELEMAAGKVKKVSTYLHDCESTNPQTDNSLLEEKQFDQDGRLTSRIEFYYNGVPKRTEKFFYGPQGDKTYQNLYNARNDVVQTKYFNRLGYDTLTTNFLENGQVRSTMQKIITYNADGFAVNIEEKDHLGRTHSILAMDYADTLKKQEEMTRLDAETGKWIGTELVRYNDKGEREFMSSSSTTNQEDAVRMEYDYNDFGKIENARLFSKDGFLIREKKNTFYKNGSPLQILDYYMDPGTSAVYQVYEENYLENGRLASYYVKTSNETINQSGEFVYDGKLLKTSIEFNSAQQPAYICTFLVYEFYD